MPKPNPTPKLPSAADFQGPISSIEGLWTANTGTNPPGVATLKVLAAVLGGVIVASIVAMALLLNHMGRKQDELAAHDSQQHFQGLLNLQSHQLAVHAADYANWDEAITSLLLRPDADWWSANAGDYAVDAFDLSFSMVVNAQDKLLFAAHNQDIAAGPQDLALTPSLRALLRSARERSNSGNLVHSAVTGLVHANGQTHLVAAVRFRPERSTSLPNPDPDALLLFARSLADGVLPITRQIMVQPGLQLQAQRQAGDIGVPLTLADGSLAGFAAWPHPQTGRQMVNSVLPWIGGLFVIIVLALVYAAARAYRLTQSIVSEARLIDTLAVRNQSILEAAAEGIVGFGVDGRVSFANRAAQRMLDQHERAALGLLLRQALDADGQGPLADALCVGSAWKSDAVVLSSQAGRRFPADLSITPVWRAETLEGAVLVFRDITERKKIQDEVHRRAHFDALTGAPNRHLLAERLEQEMARCQAAQKSLAVMVIDMDRFKKVNDSMGHEAGDLLLQQVHDRLRSCLGPQDFVARLGGDEFALVLPAISQRPQAAAMADDLVAALGQVFGLRGHSVWTGASVGIAFYPQDAQSAADLLRCAEMAMYKAKDQGRKTFHFYDRAMTENILLSRSLEVDLRQALVQQHLELFYQPILQTGSQQLSHMEALVRWRDPQRGLISPDAFIPLAEETGLIVDIGAWVLDEACRQLADWRSRGLAASVGMAVNVSGRQVPQGLPLSYVQKTLARHGVAGAQLSLEITESVLFDRSLAVTAWLDGIRALGIKLMIDDFGTGYSSLSYIKHVRANALKIDKGFIAGVVDQHEDQSLVRAILAMAHSLHLPVIAEGVETQEQLDWLHQEACDFAQGYFFSRPVPADEALQWIQAHLPKN